MTNKPATDKPCTMHERICLRPATPDDLDFFIRAHHEAYKPVITRQFGWDEALQDQFAHDAFKNSAPTIIEYDGAPAGIVTWVERPDALFLHELFLLSVCQNKGIGSFILKRSVAMAQAAGKPLHLQVLKENHAAAQLYTRHGFKPCGETPTHIQMVFAGL